MQRAALIRLPARALVHSGVKSRVLVRSGSKRGYLEILHRCLGCALSFRQLECLCGALPAFNFGCASARLFLAVVASDADVFAPQGWIVYVELSLILFGQCSPSLSLETVCEAFGVLLYLLVLLFFDLLHESDLRLVIQ